MTVPRIYSDVPQTTETCIWCLSHAPSKEPVEHVIPESMGGPWVLPGNVVCGSCNSRLSHLDRAISDPFDFQTFVEAVQGKDGRLKRVSSRGNAVAEHGVGGPTIRVNSSKQTIKLPDGRALSALGKSPRNVTMMVTEHQPGDAVEIKLRVPLVFDRAATRGAVKIAFETLAWFFGAEAALRSEFGGVRDYVLKDKGDRRVMLLKSEDKTYRHELNPPIVLPAPPWLPILVRFRLALVDFMVDLTPLCECMPELESAARATFGNDEGWHIIPDEP